MTKTLYFLSYIALALLVAGLFGAVHNQISYTVSHEYFTRFKFLQFSLLDSAVPERLRAAEVGFLASWWMGLPLGFLSGLAGFIHRDPMRMRNMLLWSLIAISAFTLGFALCGLVYGYIQTRHYDLLSYQGWFIPKGLMHTRSFLCAGYMHNSAYIGGVLAIPATWLFNVLFRHQRVRSAHFN